MATAAKRGGVLIAFGGFALVAGMAVASALLVLSVVTLLLAAWSRLVLPFKEKRMSPQPLARHAKKSDRRTRERPAVQRRGHTTR